MKVWHIFNIDESGFSIKMMTFRRSKCVGKSGTRGNSTQPKFRGSCNHINMIPVVSASGKVLTPIFVI